MSVIVRCETCGKTYGAREGNAAKRAKCPNCGNVLVVTDSHSSVSAPRPHHPATSRAAINLKCEACGKPLRAKARLAGKKSKCPACSAVVRIPEPAVAHDPEEAIAIRGSGKEPPNDSILAWLAEDAEEKLVIPERKGTPRPRADAGADDAEDKLVIAEVVGEPTTVRVGRTQYAPRVDIDVQSVGSREIASCLLTGLACYVVGVGVIVFATWWWLLARGAFSVTAMAGGLVFGIAIPCFKIGTAALREAMGMG